ncbi:MAG: divergent polysaccharide deacetylase family protein [Deltaproteobacteria bacterium]|nr:divergent polysaccharide deacetylase family protein [Deltaproteobacteria bacterium]
MAAKKKLKKKAVSRNKTSRRKSKQPVIFNELKKILVGIAVLVAVCLTVAMIADLFFHPGRVEKNKPVKEPLIHSRIRPVQEDISETKSKKKVTGLKEKSGNSIKYEVFEDIDHTIIKKPVPPVKDHKPKIAIIIDDIGYNKKIALELCDLNSNITFSILPFSPFGKYISEKLHAKGLQLMLHIPMEPVKYPDVDPGPGAILSSMPPDALLAQLKRNIQNVPYIAGANNHMGSRLTTHSDQMNQVFTILKKDNLFFIDSRTSSKSQCKASARLLKIKFAQRDVFLDNFQNIVYIKGQFKKLVDLAEKHGFAIGIGHPYKATLEALSIELPKIKNKVKIVRAGTLTAIPG